MNEPNNGIFDVLRKLDGTIDFSSGEHQWRIVMFLHAVGPSSVAEISKSLGISKKAVIDAVRKLIQKECVEKVKYDIYTLTEKGKVLMETFNKLVNGEIPKEDGDLTRNPTHFYYLVEILKVAILNKGVVPLKGLARDLGVSQNTLKFYLDVFSTKYKFFKKINKRSLLRVKTVYVLSEEGKKVANKIPEIQIMKENKYLRILTSITRSSRVEIALAKLLIALDFSFLTYFIMSPRIIHNSTIAILVNMAWISFIAFLTITSILTLIKMSKR
jgi:Mn-dependent transcriptional regulator